MVNQVAEWCFDGAPEVDGWYAVLVCWDAEEGMFPNAFERKNGAWSETSPVMGFAGPFGNKEVAHDWAYAHDPEATR
jgi:hypothetical protein